MLLVLYVDTVLNHIITKNITNVRYVVCAAAAVFGERLNLKRKDIRGKHQDSWRKRRIGKGKGKLQKEKDKSGREQKYYIQTF